MEQVIDERVSEGLPELLEERALAHESLARSDVAALRRVMEEARAKRLQPHFISDAFLTAFRRLGGKISRRESGRYEISNVPAAVRGAAKCPVATRYDRVTFELDRVDGDGLSRAELLAPGHPLHDAVLDQAVAVWGPALETGATLVSTHVSEPELLVGIIEEVIDATGTTTAKRFGYAYVNQAGVARPAGPAPYLDCVAAPARRLGEERAWTALAERDAVDWLVANQMPDYLAGVRTRRVAELARSRSQVSQRMNLEINRLAGAAMAAEQKELHGRRVSEGSESLMRKSRELEQRLSQRLALLERQQQLSTVPPRIVAAALVLPYVEVAAELPADAPMHAVATEEVERRGIDAVLAAERTLGRTPTEMAHNNPGYDIRSVRGDEPLVFLEVKARLAGAEDFFVTRTEILHGKNAAPHYRLALVSVDPRGPEHDQVRYLADPFRDTSLGTFDAEGIRANWIKNWTKATVPF